MKSTAGEKTQPDNGLPQIRVKPVKMFMQMSLIKQKIHVDNNRDALKRNKNKGGC